MTQEMTFQPWDDSAESESESSGDSVQTIDFAELEVVEESQIESLEELESGDEGSTASAPEGGDVCVQVDLVKIKNWPEFKVGVKKQCRRVLGRKICVNVPQAYQKNCELRVFAKVCHPKLSSVKSTVIKAVQESVGAGVLAGVYTGNVAAATAAMKTYLAARLASKLNPIGKMTVKVDTVTKCGDWKPR